MPVKGSIPADIVRRFKKPNCEICGIDAERAKAIGGLGIHHRDHDRTNNDPSNLLTVCPRCHTREHWLKGSKRSYKKTMRCFVCVELSKLNPGYEVREALKKGMCETHKTRHRRHGNPFLRKVKVGKNWILVDERKTP